MRGWLRGSLVAARVASDRADLWLPGALVAFAGAGWLVFLLSVAPPLDAAGLAGLGTRLAGSPWFPWNVVVLVVAVASGLGTLLLVISFGEVTLLMGLTPAERVERPPTVPRAMGILGAAALVVLAVAVLLGWLLTPGVIDAVLADPSAPLAGSILGAAWPLLLALAAVVVVMQAVAAARLRLRGGLPPGGARRVVVPLVTQAAVTTAVFVLVQAATAAMLGLLWAPLAARFADGGLGHPTTVILLLGFVWIWLVLVIMAGVVQTWTSAWWTGELDRETGG
jgi:hypothetical protein